MFRRIMSVAVAVLVCVMCVGCSPKNYVIGTQPSSTEKKTADDGADAGTTSIIKRLNGWWICDSELLKKAGFESLVMYCSEGGGKSYFETINGNFYTDFTIDEASVSENDIIMTGTKTGVSNHFYLTSDTDGEDVLAGKDIVWDDNGNYVTQFFRRCDETVIEGKNYIEVTQPTNSN